MVLQLKERIFLVEYVFRASGKYTDEVKEEFLEIFQTTKLTRVTRQHPKPNYRYQSINQSINLFICFMLQNEKYTNICEKKFSKAQEGSKIYQEEIHRVIENLKLRTDLCIREHGGHFQQLL